jgi:hypothetical protein
MLGLLSNINLIPVTLIYKPSFAQARKIEDGEYVSRNCQ